MKWIMIYSILLMNFIAIGFTKDSDGMNDLKKNVWELNLKTKLDNSSQDIIIWGIFSIDPVNYYIKKWTEKKNEFEKAINSENDPIIKNRIRLSYIM